MDDTTKTEIDELVVLSKFEGEPLPENEFERLSIHNGLVVAHDSIVNGQVAGPVLEESLLGVNIGTLIPQDEEVN